ncbi:prolipoprotein diacylglyceryl transferase [Spiroplasma endosymbiont of Villa modesta]|uniref:prolipoprotein diacylglyceryl transferase n=1 Tax=Spiroplasma endosymbiont of Villa modesta TaxID=3066293 RepID=UPI00313DBFDA
MINDDGYNSLITDIPGTGIHIYSVLMAIGFLTAVIASWIKLYRRNIPTKTLEWGTLVITLAGLIGARAWYVLNNTSTIENALDVVAVWRGGMAIEGGVTVGMIVGFFIFYRTSKQLQISMWVFIDCIVPNILLGQAIGRWGNFFNQELLGTDVGHPFSWLPTWINNHLHYGFNSDNRDPVAVYRQPLFLYESLSSLFGWFFLTFFVPKTGQIFSKKPWKLDSSQFISPLKTNPIVGKDFLKPWTVIKKIHGYRKFKYESWKQAYFDFTPNKNSVKSVEKIPWKDVKTHSKVKSKIKKWYLKIKYNMQPHSKSLNTMYNPNNYRVTYAGVSGSLYFVFYGIIRMILEPLRDNRDIMKIANVSTSMIVSGMWIILGVILVIFAQIIAPSRFRKGEWLYEKSY